MLEFDGIQKMLGYTRRACADYNMIEDGDRIAVGVSGGKDSLALLCFLAKLKRFYEKKYEIIAVTLDAGFPGADLSNITNLCKDLEIEHHIIPTDIYDIVFNIRKEKFPCSLCANLRRGALNTAAKELGCNKIALGHHKSDVIETTLMGMLYGGQIQGMLPKLKSTNFEGMELIRPLYLVREKDIAAWARYNELEFVRCACSVTDSASEDFGSKRAEIKALIAELRKKNDQIDINIFRSAENVNLETIIGYRKRDKQVSFLDEYNR